MSWNNKVLWTEGLFLKPQHFQQHERYFEHLVGSRCDSLRADGWGVRELTIDEDLLAMGKVAIASASGILPDGTPFAIPIEDPAPTPLELDEDVHAQTIYLTLPLRRPGAAVAGPPAGADAMMRFYIGEEEVRDNNVGEQSMAAVQVGALNLRLMLEDQSREGYAHMGIARVLECRADKRILLDDDYIPPCLDYRVSTKLGSFVSELVGLLHHRAETLANRVSDSGHGSVADVANFLLLQVVNRLEPLVAHINNLQGLHPETLYQLLLPMAGELATFTTMEKRPPEFPIYRHDDLRSTFFPVMVALRRALSKVLEERAIPIPIQDKRYGFRVATITDRVLLAEAIFVLAANAKISAEQLRNRFPDQVKVGPVEEIQQLVKLALPGIGLRPLPVAPRQIPLHKGFTYFELDSTNEYWAQLEKSGGFGMHIAGDFPGLELEFWAIRE